MVGNMIKAIYRFNSGKQTPENFVNSINSYFGLMRHTNSYNIRFNAWKMIDNNRRFYSTRMDKINLTNKYKNELRKINNSKE